MKYQWLGGSNTEICFLKVLESGRPRWRCWLTWFLVRAPFLASHCVLRCTPLSLLRALIPSRGPYPPKANLVTPPIIITWGTRVSTHQFHWDTNLQPVTHFYHLPKGVLDSDTNDSHFTCSPSSFFKLSWLGLWNGTQKFSLLPSSLSWTRISQASLLGSQSSVLILFISPLCESPGIFMQCHDFKYHQCAEITHVYRFSPKLPPEIQTCVFSCLYHCLCECLTGFPNLSKGNLLGL